MPAGRAPLVSTFEGMPVQPLGDPFVGRAHEVARVTAVLDAALGGRGQFVTFAGEPGIGKSRTARELELVAIARGARVLWGRCREEGGAPPFWTWIQVIRAYTDAVDPADLRRDLGAGASDIAEVVPAIYRVLPDLRPPPPLEPAQARFRFYDSVTAFLKRASARQPLVLIFDDLHWADGPSLRLLEFIAPDLAGSRMLILGTYRDSEVSRRHPLAQTLSELAKEQHYHPVLLRGLPEEDVNAFIATRLGTVPPRPLVEAIERRTEGNPLFIQELVRLLEQEGALAADRLSTDSFVLPERIPEGVREVIGRRLDRLPSDCNRVLHFASVVGRDFSLALLQGLIADLDRERLAETVEEALLPGLIEALPGAARRYRFTHVLIQQTLRDELTARERTHLHAQVANALEQLYGDDVELHAAELAHHLAEAATLDPTRLVMYSRLAGEHALAVYAYEEAAVHFERALAAKGAEPVDDEAAAILFGLGKAQAALLPTVRMREAVATLKRACDYYVATGNVEKATEVAVLPYYPVWGQPSGQTQLIVGALSLVPGGSKEAARLLCRYGRLVALEEADFDAARPALDQALAIARHSGDRALEFDVLADKANAALGDDWMECFETASRALELAAEVDDPQAELIARYSGVQSSFANGDLQGVARFGFDMLPLAESLRDRFWLASAHRARAYVFWLKGELDAARRESDLSLSAAPDEPRDLAIRAQLEYEAGNISQGESYLNRLIALMKTAPRTANMEYVLTALVIPVVARIQASHEWLTMAEHAAQTVLSSRLVLDRAIGALVWLSMEVQIGLSLIAVMHKDAAKARELYTVLRLRQHQQEVFTTVCGDRLLGLLARTFGGNDLARQHFEDALSYCEQRGLRLELAWTAYDFAEFLFDSGGHDDQARCSDLVNRALSISQELGLRPLYERSTALTQRLMPRATTNRTHPDGLTEREIEVLRLLAAGKTDRVIAEALSISVRTVGNHVSSILGKTGTTNRTEAATYALRNGLN